MSGRFLLFQVVLCMPKQNFVLLFSILLVSLPQQFVVAQGAPSEAARIDDLEAKVSTLETKVRQWRPEFTPAFILCGAFCALWAQNTRRNPWLWFFLGLFLNAICVIVVLYKNSKDIAEFNRRSIEQ
jgi:hypothetical protein